MVLHEHVHQLLWKVFRDVAIAVGHMRDEIDELPERDEAGLRAAGGRSHDDFAMALILIVLREEILHVGPAR